MTADALLKWATFPVDQQPRLLVLTGDPVQLQGFKTGDAKTAFLTGHVRSDVALPAGVLDRFTTSGQELEVPPLVVTAAELSSARFGTDRGNRTLPAWKLAAVDSTGPIMVLDPAVVSWWPPGEAFSAVYGPACDISRDGRTLTYRFTGSPSRYYRITGATAVETETALAVEVAMEFIDRGDTAIPLYAEQCEATVELDSPLGARVLVNGAGLPKPVIRRRRS